MDNEKKFDNEEVLNNEEEVDIEKELDNGKPPLSTRRFNKLDKYSTDKLVVLIVLIIKSFTTNLAFINTYFIEGK